MLGARAGACGLIVVVLASGCGGGAESLSGMTVKACATLAAARTEALRLADAAGERTAADTTARVAWIDALLAKAAEDSVDGAQARIVEVMGVAGGLLAGLESVPDARPTASLPGGLQDARTTLVASIDQLWRATGCLAPTVSPVSSEAP